VSTRPSLNGCGKSRPHRDSFPGPSTPYRVAIPTELSRPICYFDTIMMSVVRKEIWLTSDKNTGHFMGRPIVLIFLPGTLYRHKCPLLEGNDNQAVGVACEM